MSSASPHHDECVEMSPDNDPMNDDNAEEERQEKLQSEMEAMEVASVGNASTLAGYENATLNGSETGSAARRRIALTLYKRGLEGSERKNREIAQLKHQLEAKEMADCSFRPQLSMTSSCSSSMPRRDMYASSEEWEAARQRKLERLRRQLEKAELAEVKSNVTLSERTEHIARQIDWGEREFRQQERQRRVLSEITPSFQPVTTSSSLRQGTPSESSPIPVGERLYIAKKEAERRKEEEAKTREEEAKRNAKKLSEEEFKLQQKKMAERQQQAERNKQRAARALEKEVLAEATFKPAINETSKKLASGTVRASKLSSTQVSPVPQHHQQSPSASRRMTPAEYEQFLKRQESHLSKVERQKRRIAAADEREFKEECTFAPKLNRTSEKLVKRRELHPDDDPEDELYSHASSSVARYHHADPYADRDVSYTASARSGSLLGGARSRSNVYDASSLRSGSRHYVDDDHDDIVHHDHHSSSRYAGTEFLTGGSGGGKERHYADELAPSPSHRLRFEDSFTQPRSGGGRGQQRRVKSHSPDGLIGDDSDDDLEAMIAQVQQKAS